MLSTWGKVSIVIPTKNSAEFLENCLRSIRDQSYSDIETIIVDGNSKDETILIAKRYKCKIYKFIPKVKMGLFDAPYKRNFGMKRSKGQYVYWLDSDMELPKNLIKEAVTLCKKGADAVILPEDSFGIGIWAKAKQLERRCYWNNNFVECPRFFNKAVWESIGGFDESLGAGGDDLDLSQKLLEKKYVAARAKNIIMHNEGNLTFDKLCKKKFMYGREMINYMIKRPRSSFSSYFSMRLWAYLSNWELLIKNPFMTLILIFMRSVEYAAGFLGFIYSFFEKNTFFIIKNIRSKKALIIDYSDYIPQYYGISIPQLLKKYLDINIFHSILDCGCGDGALLYALKKHGYFTERNVCAIDISKKSIALVKKIDKKIHAYIDNAETMEKIKSYSIDFFISTHVIEHVDDKKMLRTIERVVKKHSIIYLGTVFKKWYGWYYYRKDGKWVMDLTHLREYTRENQLFNLIDRNKFSILENRKTLIWFPLIDFILHRFFIKNRKLFTDNYFFKILREIKIPVLGYYNWEIVLRKN